MATMTEPTPRHIPEHRYCPHCKGGIGDCRGTNQLSSTLKRRRYQCRACLKWWSLDVRITFGSIRFLTHEENEPT